MKKANYINFKMYERYSKYADIYKGLAEETICGDKV